MAERTACPSNEDWKQNTDFRANVQIQNETSDKEDHGMLKSFIDDYAVSTPAYLIKAFRIKTVLWPS